MLDHGRSFDRKFLVSRFWRSASGFWRGRSARKAWVLVALLIATVLLQLFVQYRLNFWSRDFFNAIEQKNESLLWRLASSFAPLAAASLVLAVLSVWARMTMQREWRRWLSNHLYDYWLQRDLHIRLKLMSGDHQTSEYRIAEDARLATDLPIDLAVGLLSSVLTAIVFVGVLQSVGDSLDVSVRSLCCRPGSLQLARGSIWTLGGMGLLCKTSGDATCFVGPDRWRTAGGGSGGGGRSGRKSLATEFAGRVTPQKGSCERERACLNSVRNAEAEFAWAPAS